MTRIADWFPAFPPAPTSMVRKSVMTMFSRTRSAYCCRTAARARLEDEEAEEPSSARQSLLNHRGVGVDEAFHRVEVEVEVFRAGVEGLVDGGAVQAGWDHWSRGVGGLVSGSLRGVEGDEGGCVLSVATTELSAEGGVLRLRGARGAAGRTLDPTRLRLKEAEREVPLHPGGGVSRLRSRETRRRRRTRVRARGGRASPRDCPRARRPVGRRRRPRRPRVA